MNSLALTLVLVAAVLHAVWNLLAKKAQGGSLFVWLFTTLSSVVLLPASVVLMLVEGQRLSGQQVVFLIGTALLHLAYFVFLQRAYRHGDLSLVYPIARGLGPALATLGAVVVLSERPSGLAIAGLALVVSGMFFLTWERPMQQSKSTHRAIVYGVLTGCTIATYSLWDKFAVARAGVPPIVLEAFSGAGVSLLLTPAALRNWTEVKRLWSDHKRAAVGIAVFAPLSYILVLTAMSFTPLSYVAPCREISILLATIIGARVLDEGQTKRRLVAATLMVGGVVSLALG